MLKYVLIFIACNILRFAWAQKQICLTVDDLPTVTYRLPDTHLAITNGIISTCKKNDIPAIGFVNENKLYHKGKLDETQLDLLAQWLQSGLELGNHTYSHKNYHQSSYKEFTEDILKGEYISKPLSKKYGQPYKFFRHPYLRTGLRKTHADSLASFLATHDYTIAPVTVDNEEYLFARSYARATAAGDSTLMKKIGIDYVNYMIDKVGYFEVQSKRLFDREISQVLLIHANLLNAHYLELLSNKLKGLEYEFVSLEQALKDPVYDEEITVFQDWGISWIDKWALSRGKKGDFFKNEPRTPEYISNPR